MHKSYQVGYKTNYKDLCGTDNLVVPVTTEATTLTVITTGYACVYEIRVPTYTYRDGSTISIWFENLTGSDSFVYSGLARFNATNLIEGGTSSAVGAPIVVPISEGVVVTAIKETAAASGGFQMKFQVTNA